jgi:hypothetical protein
MQAEKTNVAHVKSARDVLLEPNSIPHHNFAQINCSTATTKWDAVLYAGPLMNPDPHVVTVT